MTKLTLPRFLYKVLLTLLSICCPRPTPRRFRLSIATSTYSTKLGLEIPICEVAVHEEDESYLAYGRAS
jgi:hypothetical protein